MNKSSRNNINNKSKTNIKSSKLKKRSKGFKNTRLFKLLKIIFFIILFIIIVNVFSGIFKKSPKNITLVMGDQKINLKNNIWVDKDNNVYLSIDDISNIYDKNIYFSNNTVITTFNKHIAILEMGKTTMSVNDVVQEISGVLKEENGIIYLPFSDMTDVYDFEYSYNDENKVLIVDSTSKAKSESVVLKNAKLKEKIGAFSKTLEKVKKSEYVTVFGTERKLYKG